MKLMLKTTLFSILMFCLCTAKGQTNQTYSQLIIGTWVKEEETFDYRWEFNQQGTMNMYEDNQVYATYNWQIDTEQTQSGLIISSLILTNTNNENEVLVMEIGGINSQEMYLRSPNIPIRFIKQ